MTCCGGDVKTYWCSTNISHYLNCLAVIDGCRLHGLCSSAMLFRVFAILQSLLLLIHLTATWLIKTRMQFAALNHIYNASAFQICKHLRKVSNYINAVMIVTGSYDVRGTLSTHIRYQWEGAGFTAMFSPLLSVIVGTFSVVAFAERPF